MKIRNWKTCLRCYRAGEGPNRHCNTCPCCSSCQPHGQVACLVCYPLREITIGRR